MWLIGLISKFQNYQSIKSKFTGIITAAGSATMGTIGVVFPIHMLMQLKLMIDLLLRCFTWKKKSNSGPDYTNNEAVEI